MSPRIHQFSTNALLVDALRVRIAALSSSCLQQDGYFSIVLAGGATPRGLYQQLRQLSTDWQRWHIYFSDERCLPLGDPARNDSMAAAAWLDHVAIPSTQIHRVPSTEDIGAAATAYSSVLAQAPGFSLALLGLGEDGHTASLFPDDLPALHGTELAVAITNAPKPPPQRVSMSPKCLGMAAAVWFIVAGDNKRRALLDWLSGVPLPPQTIKPWKGVDVFTDITF